MRREKLIEIGLLLLGLVTAQGVAAHSGEETIPGLAAKIDAVAVKHLAMGQLPGLAVVVVAQGEIAFLRGYGRATESGQLVSPATFFSVGSVTKPFVGMAIHRLVQQGLISLDEPVRTYLSNFQPRNDYDRPIAVRDLLNHTSGFSTYAGNRNQAVVARGPKLLSATLPEFNEMTLQSVPGSRFEYSNANYQLLGMLIERATGMTFAEAMQALVFAPMSLADTRVGHPFDVSRAADGFRFWGANSVAYRVPLGSVLEPQGGVSSTATDLGRLLLQLMGTPEVVPAWKPDWGDGVPTDSPDVSYGLGWFVHGTGEQQIVFHHGLNPGFSAALAFSPTSRIGIAVLGNASDGFIHGDVNFVMEEIVAQVFPALGANAANYTIAWVQLGVALTICTAMLLWAVLVVRRRMLTPSIERSMISKIVPSVVPLGLAYLIGVWLPPLLGIPLAAAGMFSPDIGLVLQLTVWLCASWGSVRLFIVWPGASKAGMSRILG